MIQVLLSALSLSIKLATISRLETSECARISDRASAHARWAAIRGWMLLIGAALCIALVAMLSSSAHAGIALEDRKLPMKFSWVACQPNCRGWVSAVGIVTANSPRDFDEFARGRQLGGVTIVLDSSGGSVNDSISLGRRWRSLGALTTVGISAQTNTAQSAPANMEPVAYCESMCVFLLLSGKTRYVPETAHVRVHQIWLGDRANNAKAATYSADDLMVVERDIGRLAKYTFDMGGAGDLLSLSLNVPPWEDLHELSRDELRLTNLVTTDMVAQRGSPSPALVELTPEPVQYRFVSSAVATKTNPEPAKSTRSAEAVRTNRSSSSISRSRASEWLTADWLSATFWLSRRTLRSSMTASNTLSRFKSNVLKETDTIEDPVGGGPHCHDRFQLKPDAPQTQPRGRSKHAATNTGDLKAVQGQSARVSLPQPANPVITRAVFRGGGQ